jgi:hypothetical protein
MKGRGLNGDEITICTRVFGPTLSREFLASKVMLYDGLGAGNRPYTNVDWGIARYEIFIGPRAFDASSLTTDNYKETLVHEMTHVWQMRESSFGWVGVWVNSGLNQACHQGSAYWYGNGNLTKPWGSFGVEAQAHIVEDWFKEGLKSTDPRFHYIKNEIRKGQQGFVFDTPTNMA